ncbi:hypothetical protein [Sphingomonas sp.]|jgi:hypothetical protein|uniref:tellurite resistance TerB family protein n=1 Tax=Sphingomonas sp. TaxID=28214 RepID=UPI0026046539|nr:hypothetical protein [Sphingomonas sp.]MDF2496049.1 hypothetical protein [Sphingomonas sp.]
MLENVSQSARRLTEKAAVLPPSLTIEMAEDAAELPPPTDDTPQVIAGFICAIEYADADGVVTDRVINCRRYEYFNNKPRVGAICGTSRKYKTFYCDGILQVHDVVTRQHLGDGTLFEQFVVGAHKVGKSDWNTTSQRKSLIVAGLNVLCFMARCDGHWHELEEQVIEEFVCSLWIRKEWENEPPLPEIVAHARRLAPDGEVFRAAITQYGHSSTSAAILSRFVQRVVAADGVICDAEHRWGAEFEELLAEAQAGAVASR